MIKTYFIQHSGATVTPWLTKGSSFIDGIKYDTTGGTLYVKIKGKTYDYQVPITLADQFSNASSWGKFYAKYIKNKIQPSIKTKVVPQITKTITEKKPTKADNAIKDVAGTAWGVAELAVTFAPLPISSGARMALLGANIVANSYLTKKGIERPVAIEAVIDLATGVSIFAGLKGVSSRLSSYYATAKTPYFNLGYKAGTVSAKVTPAQASAGILFGGTKWKERIVRLETEKAASISARAMAINKMTKDFIINKAMKPIGTPELPGFDSKIFITPNEMKELDAMIESTFKKRKIGQGEKALDFIIDNQKYLPFTLAAGYTGISEIYNVQRYKAEKKKEPKKEEPFAVKVSQQGLEIAAEILHM